MGIEDFEDGYADSGVSSDEKLLRDETMRKGRAAEYRAAANLVERGYNVSLPNEQAPFDLLALTTKEVYRIQVKFTNHSSTSGSYSAQIGITGSSQLPLNTYKEYYDFLIVRTPENWYIIPAEVVDGNKTIDIGPRKPREKWKDNWDFKQS